MKGRNKRSRLSDEFNDPYDELNAQGGAETQ
jgi:hypothetical protein